MQFKLKHGQKPIFEGMPAAVRHAFENGAEMTQEGRRPLGESRRILREHLEFRAAISKRPFSQVVHAFKTGRPVSSF